MALSAHHSSGRFYARKMLASKFDPGWFINRFGDYDRETLNDLNGFHARNVLPCGD